MPFLHVPYEDGSQWLVSHCEVVIAAEEAKHLTALEIGERVLALLPRTHFLAEHIDVWSCNPELQTIEDVEVYLANEQSQPRQRQRVVTTTKPAKGFVYIIRGDVYYKIGRTADPYKRLTPMTAKAPFPLNVLLLIPTENMIATEQALHQRFAHKQTQGEWFNLCEEDISALRQEYTTLDAAILKAQ